MTSISRLTNHFTQRTVRWGLFECFEFRMIGEPSGGDFITFQELTDRKLAITIGEVAGCGQEAVEQRRQFTGALNKYFAQGMRPAEVCTRVNRELRDPDIPQAVIMVALVLDTRTRDVAFVNAASSPYFRCADGSIERLNMDASDLPLFTHADHRFPERLIKFTSDEAIVICTDGLVNGLNESGKIFKAQPIECRLKDSNARATEIGQLIVNDFRQFTAGWRQPDDVSLLCIGRQRNG